MKILILKSFGLGNLIEATPMIRELHTAGHRVSLLADNGPTGFPAKQLFEGWDKLHEIVEFDRSTSRDGNDIVKWIQSEGFDLIIQSFPSDNLFNWLFPLVDIPIRKAPIVTGFWDRHEVQYNFDLVRDLIQENPFPFYELQSFSAPKIDNIIEAANGKTIIVVCPSYKREGLWWKKHWGNEKYAEFITLLPEKFYPILLDGKDGIADCNAINFMAGGRALNLAGQLHIRESCRLIELADLIIANDSGTRAYSRGLSKESSCIIWTNFNKKEYTSVAANNCIKN